MWQLKKSNCDSNKNDSSDISTSWHLDNRPTLRAAFCNSCDACIQQKYSAVHGINFNKMTPLREVDCWHQGSSPWSTEGRLN